MWGIKELRSDTCLVDSLTCFQAVVDNEAVQQVRHDSDDPVTIGQRDKYKVAR